MKSNVEDIIKKHMKGKTFESLETESSIIEMENKFCEKYGSFGIGIELYLPAIIPSFIVAGYLAYAIFGQ